MTDDTRTTDASAEKDPNDWTTGDEPATAAQLSYLQTMATEAGKEAPKEGITKSEASKMIEEFQQATGRGE